jgi:asparagine synthase (glutamine-hydrolysing)
MCGIFGFTGKSEGMVRSICNSMCHRGPDDKGAFSDGNITFGQLRLAIIDLTSGGHQPMFYSKKLGASNEKFNQKNISSSSCSIVFNGEIYNFQDIKSELESKGYKFSTKSDTEVILAAYVEWGFDCVKKFNGMWAFALYDMEKQILFCSRDRLGKKPFYYYHNQKEKKFIFSSELKGIMSHGVCKNIDSDAVDIYLTTGFIPSPMTIYKEVSKLEPRESLVYNFNTGVVSKHFYYDIPKYNPVYDKKKLVEEGKALLKDATRLRLIADVPVGAFLSGGLDSSSVVATMAGFTNIKKLHTFSIGFEERQDKKGVIGVGSLDESKYIMEVKDAIGTIHHHKYYTQDDFEKMVDRITTYYDEPFGDYSSFPTYEVSRLAREHVTVALSGDGGDEIFGGYYFHKVAAQLKILGYSPRIIRMIVKALIPGKDITKLNGAVKEAFKMSLESPEDFYAVVGGDFVYKPEAFKKWSREKMREVLQSCNGNFREAIIRYDLFYNTMGDNFLVKVDRASMANSLEVRCPFLDYRFVELEAKIPVEWKTDGFKTKILLRDIIKDLVPENILNRGKQGFTPPMEEWVAQDKHQAKLRKGLVMLYTKGVISSQWKKFYDDIEKLHTTSNNRNRVYAIYEIRLYFLILWAEKWLSVKSK